MYEALLNATPEYQKISASFAKPGPAALFGLPPAGRALLYAALQKDLGRVLCIVTPGEAEATHFADDLRALGLYYTGRKAEALPFARKAAELSPSPRLLENVRLIENEVGESTNTQL